MPLIGHYPLDEATGKAHDHSATHNDATVNGATHGADGILGTGAYSFDGTDDHLTVADYGLGAGDVTISAWVYPETIHRGTILRRYDGTDDVIQFFITENGELAFQVGHAGGTEINNNGVGSYTSGAWNHLVAVLFFDEGINRIYRDGVLQNELTGSVADFTDTTTVNIGRAEDGSNHLNGRLSDLRVYNHALSPAEVRYLYRTGTTGTVMTDTKTHGSAVSPDYKADVDLNGQAATAYIIGSPGTSSEEMVSVALSDGVNRYALSWANTHTDFRTVVVTDLSDPGQRVEVNRSVLEN